MCIFKKMYNPSQTAHRRAAEHCLIKDALNKMFLQFNFRRGLFYAKMLNSKICIWPSLDWLVWGCHIVSGKYLIKKLSGKKKFLEFDFRKGLFLSQKFKIQNL